MSKNSTSPRATFDAMAGLPPITPRTLTGILLDGTSVLVTVWPNGGGRIAFREMGRWGVPTELSEKAPS